jgi:hypothetical protein
MALIHRAGQWRAPKLLRLTVARRRRIFTVFPCAESRVIVDGSLDCKTAVCESRMRALAELQTISLENLPRCQHAKSDVVRRLAAALTPRSKCLLGR